MPNFLQTPTAFRDPERYLNEIWQASFADISRVNQVTITYGPHWKHRLGKIWLDLDTTITHISVNGLLRLEQVPDCVLVTTIAHELVHYAHGFGSPLPRLYQDPHANNVVTRELERRGLGETLHQCNAWINVRWFSWYAEMQQAGQLAANE